MSKRWRSEALSVYGPHMPKTSKFLAVLTIVGATLGAAAPAALAADAGTSTSATGHIGGGRESGPGNTGHIGGGRGSDTVLATGHIGGGRESGNTGHIGGGLPV